MEIKLKANRAFRDADLSRCRYVMLKGSAGSGKSADTAQNYILRLMQDKGRNLLALRKSEVTNRDSTFAELKSAISRLGVWEWWQEKSVPIELVCRLNGNRVIFRGMNDTKQREKIKSITFENGSLTDIWLEEATEFTREDLDILDDRLRGKLPSGLFYQIRGTFNPVSATHWLKAYFFDTVSADVCTCHSTYLDNRFIDDAYKRRMERRRELDPEGYRVYGLGEWGETGGLILQNWTVKDISLEVTDYGAVSLGQDFGYNHANAILLLGFKDDDIYILREQYEYEKDTAELINMCSMPKDVFMYCDSAEPDRIKSWRKAGYKALPVVKDKGAENGYINRQIDWLKQRRIYINPSCVNTIKELSEWKWQRDDKRGIWLDSPVPFFDDAIAALRYGVEPWRKVRRMQSVNKSLLGV